MTEKLSRRNALKLASSAAALGAGLGVDLTARDASAASRAALQFKVEIEGTTLATLELDQEAIGLIRKVGAEKLLFRTYGAGLKVRADLGAFRLPAAVQHKVDSHVKEG
ncbi:MAG: twin-arginine translocation signal domain-containing protein [Polyangiaceae bacterium]